MTTKLPYALLGILIATMVVGLVFWRRDRRSFEALAKDRDQMCQRQEWDLESIMANEYRGVRNDLHVRIPDHHLDQGLIQLCFGKPIVVDAGPADNRWIMTERGDDCYVDVAEQLLAAYRARRK